MPKKKYRQEELPEFEEEPKVDSETYCLRTMVNLKTAKQRLQTATQALAFLKDYQRTLNSVRRNLRENEGRCRNLSQQMADKAFEAEQHLRILIKHGADSLNDLRDNGRLEYAIRSAMDKGASLEGKGIEDSMMKGFQIIKDALHKDDPELDTGFIDEINRLMEENDTRIRTDRRSLNVRVAGLNGKDREFRIEPESSPGNLGRVSSTRFFNVAQDSSLITSVVPMYVLPDCHHRDRTLNMSSSARVVDPYGSIMASFAVAKDMLYRHARKTDEIGITAYEGDVPIAAALIALAVVAAVAVVAGLVIQIGCAAGAWSGDVCDFGFALIVGGIILGGTVCVLSGECEFVVAFILGIGA